MNQPECIYLIDNTTDRNLNLKELLSDNDVFNSQLKRFLSAHPHLEVYLKDLDRIMLPSPKCLLDGDITKEKEADIVAKMSGETNRTALLFLDFGLTAEDLDEINDPPYLRNLLSAYAPSNSRLWVVASGHAGVHTDIDLGHADTRVSETGSFRKHDYSPILFFALAEWRRRNADLYSRFLEEITNARLQSSHEHCKFTLTSWGKNNTPSYKELLESHLGAQLHELAVGRRVGLDVAWYLAYLVHQSAFPHIVDNPFSAAKLKEFYDVPEQHSFLLAQDSRSRMLALDLFGQAFKGLFVHKPDKHSTVTSAILNHDCMTITLAFAPGKMNEYMQHFVRKALEHSIELLATIGTRLCHGVANYQGRHQGSGLCVAFRQAMHVVDPSALNPGESFCGADCDLLVKESNCGNYTIVELK